MKTTLALLLYLPMVCLGLDTNVVKFYLHPDLVTNYALVQTNLGKYIDDMNEVIAKNTTRRLTFNPATGIVITNQAPHNNTEPLGGPPLSGYEIWVWIRKSTTGTSHGGSLGIDSSGAAAISSMQWTTVRNPYVLAAGSAELQDYWDQLTTMLHEYGHIYGAGSQTGEYYNYNIMTDDTGVPPLTTMQSLNPTNLVEFNYNDNFWGRHLDFATDPLLRRELVILPTKTRQQLLDRAAYSVLSAACISGPYREISLAPPLPLTNEMRLVFKDAITCLPVEGVHVRIWRINHNPTLVPTTKIVDTVTGTNGTVIWNWDLHGGGSFSYLNNDPIRLIKYDRVGYGSNAYYLGGIDLHEIRILQGHILVTNTITMNRPRLRLLSVTTNQIVRVTNTIPGRTFTVYVSEDLTTWYPIVTNTPTTQALFTYTNSPWLGFPKLFYAAKEPSIEGCAPIQEGAMMMQSMPEQTATRTKKTFPAKIELPPMPKRFASPSTNQTK